MRAPVYLIFIAVSQPLYSNYRLVMINLCLSDLCNLTRRDGGDQIVKSTMQSESLKLLEGLLVKEFRATQSLLRLIREEQQALANNDIPRLLALAEHKEIWLDRLSGMEAARRGQVAALAGGPLPADTILPPEVLCQLEPEVAARLAHLADGIHILTDQVRELARANQTLAAAALDRAASQQAGLLNGANASLPEMFAAILDARDAIDAQDPDGVDAAVGSLQHALRPEPKPAGEAGVFDAPAPAQSKEANAGLVETIANLYRMEQAYRAVLRASSRVIAGPL